MADDKSNEYLRELRGIRYALYFIVLVLCLIFLNQSLHLWAESMRPPRTSAIETHGDLERVT